MVYVTFLYWIGHGVSVHVTASDLNTQKTMLVLLSFFPSLLLLSIMSAFVHPYCSCPSFFICPLLLPLSLIPSSRSVFTAFVHLPLLLSIITASILLSIISASVHYFFFCPALLLLSIFLLLSIISSCVHYYCFRPLSHILFGFLKFGPSFLQLPTSPTSTI